MSSVNELRKKYDTSDMFSLIINMPKDLRRYLDEFDKELPEELSTVKGKARLPDIDKVVFLGMGGSAIGGDIVFSYLYEKLRKPVSIVRDFKIPGFVDSNTLVIGVSYSGNTDETIAATLECIKKGTYVVLLTSNGVLETMGEKFNIPIYRLPRDRPPRTAIASMLAALLRVSEKTELADVNFAEIYQAADFLESIMERYKNLDEDDLPYKLASDIVGSIPLIYSYKPYSPIGFRFKTQLNENAKIHAFYAEIPEANHNEIMGWEGPLKEYYFPVFLRGKSEPEEIKVRVDFWGELLKEFEVDYLEIESSGPNLFGELLYLLATVDMTSYILALLRKVDPYPVGIIHKLKEFTETKLSFKKKITKEINSRKIAF